MNKKFMLFRNASAKSINMLVTIFAFQLLYICIPYYLCSQTSANLVVNSSFENISADFSCDAGEKHYNELKEYWDKVAPWQPPMYKDGCISTHNFGQTGNINYQSASADHFCDGGHTGDNYAQTLFREYVVAPLIAPLKIGYTYYIEFYVKGSVSRCNSGLRFFEGIPKQCGYHQLTDDGEAHIGVCIPINSSTWNKVVGYYKADKPYSWVGLGAFYTGSFHGTEINNGPGYRFDDISIIEVGFRECPDVNYIQNVHLQDIGKIVYKSEDLTIAGYNIASTLTPGNVVIDNNAIVEFKSATKIVLEPGFSTFEGAYFEARIAPCASECFPPPAINAGANVTVCGNNVVQLGELPQENITYTWTATPSSALAHLSNSGIANPIFSPVAGVPISGLITYTLTATNECGESFYDNVTILYEPNPDDSPLVSVSNINSTDNNVEFDINFDLHTEQILVEVYTTAGTLVNTFTYNLGTDFSCCTYHWQITVALSPCNDYQIKVSTKNMCSNVFSEPVIVNWVRNRTLAFTQVCNIITPSQPTWCFYFTGAIEYEVTITSASGVPVYANTGPIGPTKACIWSGECNQSQCSNSPVSDGTYFYILKIKGCDGSIETTTGFITVLINGRKATNSDNSEKIVDSIVPKASLGIEMYPNPNSGIISLKINGFYSLLNKIEIYNSIGSIIYKTETDKQILTIDISSYPTGIYTIKVENDNGMVVQKIIYN